MTVPARETPVIHFGLLGWSNKRPGLEFYRWDENTIPRHDSEWGDLLVGQIQREHGNAEGCPVVVLFLPRQTNTEGLGALSDVILQALARDGAAT